MAEDDGIMLNLTPYVPKEKTKSKQNVVGRNESESVVNMRDTTKKKKHRPTVAPNKDHRYIDPKDFTPVSTLFNKNPEIPTAPEVSKSEKRQEIVFSSDKVEDLPINSRLKNNLKDQFKFTTLTQVQKLSIPKLLQGLDVLVKSPTGSGKTICYSVPILEKLTNMDQVINRSDGAYAIVIVPTRELAFQSFNVIQDLCKSCISIVPGLLIGGEKCKSEKARIRKGINIVIATPGRLAYHLQETKSFDVSKVMFLVLDEADKLLDMGFQKPIKEIIGDLDKKGGVTRQSILLSATLTNDIQELASLALNQPVFVDSETNDATSPTTSSEHKDYIVPNSLQQNFVTVPAKLRLVTLLTFIVTKVFTDSTKTKVMVFVSNINSVTLLLDILKVTMKQYFGVESAEHLKNIQALHGDMSQPDRFKAFEGFKKSSYGILLCTDVAARGLDIKGVDWIVQFSCPTQIEDYLHRVGRTARIGTTGKSLLFVLPSEIQYISLLSKSNVVLKEIKLKDILVHLLKKSEQKGFKVDQKVEEKATQLQSCVEEAISKTNELQKIAIQAYKSYIQSYATYPSNQKHIFHLKHLHLGHVAKSFGLREAPTKIANVQTSQALTRKQVFDKEKLEKENTRKRKLKRDIEMSDGVFTGPKPKKERSSSAVGKKFAIKNRTAKRKTKIRIR